MQEKVKTEQKYYSIDERLSQLVESIGRWADQTFAPDGGYRGPGIVAHLRKELEELAANPTDMYEVADCLILLFHLAWQNQTQHRKDALFRYIAAKHEINRKRKWGEPDENGVVEHIR